MFVSSRVYNIFSCSINKGTDITDLAHSDSSLLQPRHILEDESVTLFFFYCSFSSSFKRSSKNHVEKDGAKRDAVILCVLNMTMLKRYLPMSKFYTSSGYIVRKKRKLERSALI